MIAFICFFIGFFVCSYIYSYIYSYICSYINLTFFSALLFFEFLSFIIYLTVNEKPVVLQKRRGKE